MKKLSEYVNSYHSFVEKNERDKLEKLIYDVTNKVKSGGCSANERQFLQYLWSFNRSTGKHAHFLTNQYLQGALTHDPFAPITPKLKKIKIRKNKT